ncbi:hypothetical protein IQ266_00130 [filamentous cyanobacterium LEGE 11480]|uniref:Uncharacterized protein n=1 Tax=Romeriopsis navalis LEGE 11480 TaxID=2777977 RepID=A0A928Z292_9CYAN|nr:hypothetical protein [Romeriopsis navalis]MBE9028160.1 hypothetical protein [Romeriopsis navalis LEGE 11480]
MSHPSHWRTATTPALRPSPFPSTVVSDTTPRFPKAVFLVGRHPETLQPVEILLNQLKCDVRWVKATDQITAVDDDVTYALPLAPCLVIVADADREWAEQSVYQLRQLLDMAQVTIVTVSDRQNFAKTFAAADSFADRPLADGHLVNPVHRSVLGTLVHSAAVRQFCHLMTAC